MTAKWSYARAGVSIDRGNSFVGIIRRLSKGRKVPGEVGNIGGFSGFFDPAFLKIKSPLLVGTTDGVGTKLEIAQALGKHDTVGVDLVAMCVNDLICTGARPLFFLDYFACGKLDLSVSGEVLRGILRGCKDAGCALIGGETAEMPGFYPGKRYDLAGFSVGIVARERVIDGRSIRPGDVILGLASSGFHSNGFSLLRKLFSGKDIRGAWGPRLLVPTKIYVKPVLDVAGALPVKGIAHITGGAYLDKIPRIIPRGLTARIRIGSWPVPGIFSEAVKRGGLSRKEAFRTFNMGIGMILVLAPKDVSKAARILRGMKIGNWPIGEIAKSGPGREKVVLEGELGA